MTPKKFLVFVAEQSVGSVFQTAASMLAQRVIGSYYTPASPPAKKPPCDCGHLPVEHMGGRCYRPDCACGADAKLSEDAAANCAGTGNIAGLGVGAKGEPGVRLKKRKITDDTLEDDTLKEDAGETFAGAPVFTVDMDRIHNARFGKNRYHRFSKYVGTDEAGEAIRQHGRANPGDIILKDGASQVMTYLRRAYKKD